jgi:hypothetical protein
MSLEAWGGGDDHDGYVTEDRAVEMFVAGAQAMREKLARYAEASGHFRMADVMRNEWSSYWGKDPGKPDKIVNDPWDA